MATRDFDAVNHGSILILRPVSEEARHWVDENLDPEALWFARGVVIEPRYFAAIAEGILAEGLTIN